MVNFSPKIVIKQNTQTVESTGALLTHARIWYKNGTYMYIYTRYVIKIYVKVRVGGLVAMATKNVLQFNSPFIENSPIIGKFGGVMGHPGVRETTHVKVVHPSMLSSFVEYL